jgi:hypothetical protein
MSKPALSCLLALLAGTGLLLAAEPGRSHAALRNALTFHAAFDGTPDADFARADRRIYTAADRNSRDTAVPGLPEGAQIARGEGRFGDALEFRRKLKEAVFFRGGDNLGYRPAHWAGAVSFWMRLDPEKDLEPGYCDPFQFVAQAWTEGNMFVEFSKDHSPRHFRFGIMPVTKFWNPHGRKYEEMPVAERPIVSVDPYPFRRDRWTHVLVTFANINSGTTDGRGTLYLDGKNQGSLTGWNHTFNWDVAKSALTLGVNYTGYLDDFAIFDRELTDDEVRIIFELPDGVRGLHARP